METGSIYIIISALLLIILALSGIVLRRGGKPYKNFVLTLHKLSTIAAIVFIWITISSINHSADLGIILSTLILILVIASLSFISGVLQSFPKDAAKYITVTHRITSYVAIIFIIYKLTQLI
jgi:hypothetical protein